MTAPAQGLVEALTEVLGHEAVHEWINTAGRGRDTPLVMLVLRTVVSSVGTSYGKLFQLS